MTEVQIVARKVMTAGCAEDVFGDVASAGEMTAAFRSMARILHPDHAGADKAAAEAMARLLELRDNADRKFQEGTFGKRAPLVSVEIRTKRVYKNVQPLTAGDLADIYVADVDGEKWQALLKLTRKPGDDDLAIAEWKTLERLWREKDKDAANFQRYLPKLVESAKIKIGGVVRRANIFQRARKANTIAEVLAARPRGVDARDMAWMWRRMLERLRAGGRHGSCGIGFGETIADSLEHPQDCLRAADLAHFDTLAWKLSSLRLAKAAEALRLTKDRGDAVGHVFHSLDIERRMIERLYAIGKELRVATWDEIATRLRAGGAVFEGAQGVLLDEWHGFHPYTTWSTTTADNARAAIVAADAGAWLTIGVTRQYATRHGAGPFPTEISVQAPAGEHNRTHDWQGTFRMGAFDVVLTAYAIEVVGRVDALAITCCDHERRRACVAYQFQDRGDRLGDIKRLKVSRQRDLDRQEKLGDFLRTVRPVFGGPVTWDEGDIARELGVPLAMTSYGPRARHKGWRPGWA